MRSNLGPKYKIIPSASNIRPTTMRASSVSAISNAKNMSPLYFPFSQGKAFANSLFPGLYACYDEGLGYIPNEDVSIAITQADKLASPSPTPGAYCTQNGEN
jgi:hypothetical protein